MDRIFGVAVFLVRALWPPADLSGEPLRRWAQGIAVMNMAQMFWQTVVVVVALGYTSLYPGLARASDTIAAVGAIDATLRDIRSGLREGKLRDLDAELIRDRTAFCVADRDHNLQAKQFADDRFRTDYQAYYDASGRSWRIPDCSELI